MLCVVVVFGAHSLVDWTWYVPGNACVALLCGGWLAGRGPLSVGAPPHGPTGPLAASARGAGELPRPSSTRMLVAAAVIVAALLAAWSQWQPQRSEEARQEADTLLDANKLPAARAAADRAVARDSLSVEALFTLAGVQEVADGPAVARATLQRAVRLQPSNPQTWLVLGRYDLRRANATAAVQELRAAIFLDPELISPEAIANGQREAIEVHNDYIRALELAAQQQATAQATATDRAAARRAPTPGAAALRSASESRARAAARAHRHSASRHAPP
jgi:tetratricopeptide (TPR) repeat protein